MTIVHGETCPALTERTNHLMGWWDHLWIPGVADRGFDTPGKVHMIAPVYSWLPDEDISSVFVVEKGAAAVDDANDVGGVLGVRDYPGDHSRVGLYSSQRS